MNEHFTAVIAELTARRKPIADNIESLSKKLKELDSLIAGVQAVAASSTPHVAAEQSSVPATNFDTYSNMSMRWAILYMLTEHISGRLGPADISKRLLFHGFPQTASFNSKVSAILSQMQTRGEVDRLEDGWAITTTGKAVWSNIKEGDKFKSRHLNSDGVTTK